MGEKPGKMKEFVLSKLGKGSEKVRELVEKTELHEIICSPLKFRLPWEVLRGNVTKGNVCVTGDAFHPMTPDLGQGACSSLEDGVVLARCLGRAMLARKDRDGEEEEYRRIEKGLEDYAKERRWRAFTLMATAYVLGFIEQGSWKLLQPLRDVLAPFLNGMTPFMADYDCGKLI